jgi:probable selenium-dependent hydroxylase accessory protein YqeC
MDLSEALGLGGREVVALVGGGGKTTMMYRLCRDAARRGRRAVATGTARFTPPADGLDAPSLVDENEERLVISVAKRLSSDEPWIIAATGHGSQGRLLPLSYDAVARLTLIPDLDLIAIEADGSAMRPFKAPAEHEPAVPPSATIVVAVVGADIFGRSLAEDAVHRPERVAALTGAEPGAPVTPAMVAAVLSHPEGGCKDVPAGARFVALINKVTPAREQQARETAKLLLDAGIERVVLAQVREEQAVVGVLARSEV